MRWALTMWLVGSGSDPDGYSVVREPTFQAKAAAVRGRPAARAIGGLATRR
jgi:hypothetical protein